MFGHTKHWNTRHHRLLRRSIMPVLSKIRVQITSRSKNNTFEFLEFWNIRPKTQNRKTLSLQGLPKRRNPFFEKLFEKRVSFKFLGFMLYWVKHISKIFSCCDYIKFNWTLTSIGMIKCTRVHPLEWNSSHFERCSCNFYVGRIQFYCIWTQGYTF